MRHALIRPHPEERACSVLLQSRTSMRASATECALMLRDASQRSRVAEASVLASRCDAPQHEGGARCLLAERSAAIRSSPRKRGPMITAGGYGPGSPLAVARVGRDDNRFSLEHQPAAAGNDCR